MYSGKKLRNYPKEFKTHTHKTVKIYPNGEGQHIKYADSIQVILEQWFKALHKRVG